VILVAVYVDDIITAGKPSPNLTKFRNALHKEYGMKDGGKLEWYLGCRFSQTKNGWSMDQNLYVKQKLEEFENDIGLGTRTTTLPSNYESILRDAEKSDELEPDFPYRNMVGSLMYCMVGTRLDIAFAVSIVSRFLHNPKKHHCDLVRHIFKYLRGNPNKQLEYKMNSKLELTAWCDAAYANHEKERSTSGFVLTFGNTAVSWYSKRQSTVAMSSAESEYIAACECTKEVVWFRQLLLELNIPQECTIIHEDNQAAIALSKNPEYHSRTKHIQVQYHWIREQVKDKQVTLSYIPTAQQLADCFTKPLMGKQVKEMTTLLGLLDSDGESRLE
jgi:hypothetical protein